LRISDPHRRYAGGWDAGDATRDAETWLRFLLGKIRQKDGVIMSPSGLSAGVGIWSVNILLAMVVGITGWNVNRTCQQIDEHENRIQTVEKAIVRFETVPGDIKEIKNDLKQMAKDRRPQ